MAVPVAQVRAFVEHIAGADGAAPVALPVFIARTPRRGGVGDKCLSDELRQARPGLGRDPVQFVERLHRSDIRTLQAVSKSDDDVPLLVRPAVKRLDCVLHLTLLDAVAHLDRDGIRRQQVFEDRTHLVVPQSAPPWCQREKVACGKDRVIGGRQQLDIFEEILPLTCRARAEGSEEPRGSQNGDALAHLLALLVGAPVACGQPLAVLPRIDDRLEGTIHL